MVLGGTTPIVPERLDASARLHKGIASQWVLAGDWPTTMPPAHNVALWNVQGGWHDDGIGNVRERAMCRGTIIPFYDMTSTAICMNS
jgi:hypothetical protein